jgi:hypothetical protein
LMLYRKPKRVKSFKKIITTFVNCKDKSFLSNKNAIQDTFITFLSTDPVPIGNPGYRPGKNKKSGY